MTKRNFDIEKIKAGAKVVDREGNEWVYVGTVPHEEYPHVFWLSSEEVQLFQEDGMYIGEKDHRFDLTIAPQKKKLWLYVRTDNKENSPYYPTTNAFLSKDDAEKLHDLDMNNYQIVEIEIDV